jgi:hypothetical protein
MFGLSVMLTMTLSGHPWIINKIENDNDFERNGYRATGFL